MKFGRNIYTAPKTITVRDISTQKMELATQSETSVTTYEATLWYIQKINLGLAKPSEFND
jgi:hypothetical protein